MSSGGQQHDGGSPDGASERELDVPIDAAVSSRASRRPVGLIGAIAVAVVALVAVGLWWRSSGDTPDVVAMADASADAPGPSRRDGSPAVTAPTGTTLVAPAGRTTDTTGSAGPTTSSSAPAGGLDDKRPTSAVGRGSNGGADPEHATPTTSVEVTVAPEPTPPPTTTATTTTLAPTTTTTAPPLVRISVTPDTIDNSVIFGYDQRPLLTWDVTPSTGFSVTVTGQDGAPIFGGQPFTVNAPSGSRRVCPGIDTWVLGWGQSCGMNPGTFVYEVVVRDISGTVVARETATLAVEPVAPARHP